MARQQVKIKTNSSRYEINGKLNEYFRDNFYTQCVINGESLMKKDDGNTPVIYLSIYIKNNIITIEGFTFKGKKEIGIDNNVKKDPNMYYLSKETTALLGVLVEKDSLVNIESIEQGKNRTETGENEFAYFGTANNKSVLFSISPMIASVLAVLNIVLMFYGNFNEIVYIVLMNISVILATLGLRSSEKWLSGASYMFNIVGLCMIYLIFR